MRGNDLIRPHEEVFFREDAGGNIAELERARKQKDVLEALEMVSWW